MKNEVYFHLPFRAVGKQSVRNGGAFYIPDKSKNFMKRCADIFSHAMPCEMFTGPVMVEITCYFARPKTVAETVKWMARKPDVDNIEKSIYDAGSGIVWKDDDQIVLSLTKKYWNEDNFIEVSVSEL